MSAAPFPLAYCLNVHRADTLDDVLRAMHEPPNINRIRFPFASAVCILAALACQLFLPDAARATDAAYAPVSSRFKPRPLPAHADPLGDLFGGDLLDSDGQPADPADLEGKFIGLYFSASWCPRAAPSPRASSNSPTGSAPKASPSPSSSAVATKTAPRPSNT